MTLVSRYYNTSIIWRLVSRYYTGSNTESTVPMEIANTGYSVFEMLMTDCLVIIHNHKLSILSAKIKEIE
jgi:hypothetical protein